MKEILEKEINLAEGGCTCYRIHGSNGNSYYQGEEESVSECMSTCSSLLLEFESCSD